MGVAWCLARIAYAIGYTNPNKTDGRGRMIGSVSALPELGLMVAAGWAGWKMVIG